jgi:hypothetical protein
MTISPSPSLNLTPAVYVVVRDCDGNSIKTFNTWESLKYTRICGGIDTCEIAFVDTYNSMPVASAERPSNFFNLDYIVEIMMSFSSLSIPPFRDSITLHRSDGFEYDDNGNLIYKSTSLGLNDFLARTVIGYLEGTIKSYKYAYAESAMKQYVEENCGPTATVAAPGYRERDSVLPHFIVEPIAGYGEMWEGDKAFENLYEVIKLISSSMGIDFWIEYNNPVFTFRTKVGQIGENRSIDGLDSITGKNSYGNYPVIFSYEAGNCNKIGYTKDRTGESTVIFVLGEGDSSTRLVISRDSAPMYDSIWNRREIARPENGYISQMEAFGDNVLAEQAAKEDMSFSPLQTSSLLYGVHYFLGDTVTIKIGNIFRSKKIVSVTTEIKKDGSRELSMQFSDLLGE